MTTQTPPSSPPEQGGTLGRELVSAMSSITRERIGEAAISNAHINSHWFSRGQSLAQLRHAPIGKSDSAIVIAAGPSIKRFDPIKAIKEANYQGAIIATDSAMAYCLRQGVVPDLVLTVDPHATRIVRWFGDPTLTEERLAHDDYFSRQDMDEAFRHELNANHELMALLDEHGHKIRIALATSASTAVVNRVFEIGMEVYWWNPMQDDPDLPNSITRSLQKSNRFPCVNAGGNVGSACWMMAHAVLGKNHIALTGMDFSYYDGIPYKNTQYYHEAIALVGEENLDSFFMRIFNPYLNAWFYTDPAYRWYREVFLEMVQEADCQTYNCTQGGILFGEGIHFIPLETFLKLNQT